MEAQAGNNHGKCLYAAFEWKTNASADVLQTAASCNYQRLYNYGEKSPSSLEYHSSSVEDSSITSDSSSSAWIRSFRTRDGVFVFFAGFFDDIFFTGAFFLFAGD